jgi:membrane protease subunit (stomatin/prohibitin family)
MGIFDFVKQGTQEMCIARPDAMKQLIIYKHPDQTVPMYAQLTIDSDECAVFFKDGKVVGVLGPGRHTMQTSNIPFLGSIVDKFTGGNLFIAEVFFVKTAPVRGCKFGGTLADLEDPMTSLIVSPRIFGEFAVQVVDPATFIVQYVGQAAAGDNDAVLDWIKGQFMLGARTVIGQLCDQEQISILKTASLTKQIGDRFLRECPELASCGLRVAQMGMFNLNFSDEDLKSLKEFQSKIAEKKQAMKIAQMDVSQAGFEGQAAAARQQATLDQKFQQDARYVQQLAGNYNNYAAGQAMMGAGQGMAKGGEGAGMGLMGAQMAMGVGMANAMGQQMQGAGAAPQFQPQYGAPNAQAAQAQQPTTAAGGTVTCGACKANVLMGKFCAECGGPLGQMKKFCTGCGSELAGGAKFCAGCGTRAPG